MTSNYIQFIEQLIEQNIVAPENKEQAIAIANQMSTINTVIPGWSLEDVRSRVMYILGIKSTDHHLPIAISDQDAEAVLELLGEEFDANVGINWVLIDSAIEELLEKHEIEVYSGFSVAIPNQQWELEWTTLSTFLTYQEAFDYVSSLNCEAIDPRGKLELISYTTDGARVEIPNLVDENSRNKVFLVATFPDQDKALNFVQEKYNAKSYGKVDIITKMTLDIQQYRNYP